MPVWLRIPVPETESLATLGELAGAAAQRGGQVACQFEAARQVRLGHGEAQIGPIFTADALHDHVDDDPARGNLLENLCGQTRPVRHSDHRDAGLSFVERDVLDDQILHALHPGDDVRGVVRQRPGSDAAVPACRRRFLVQTKNGMNGAERLHGRFAVHEHGDLDLARGDHEDIDALVGQRRNIF